MTIRQAVDALTAHVDGQGTQPHVVLAAIAPPVAARFDEPALLAEDRELVGPFAGRRAAEQWAAAHYADKPAVVWSVAQVRTPEWVEEDVRWLRRTIGPDRDDDE